MDWTGPSILLFCSSVIPIPRQYTTTTIHSWVALEELLRKCSRLTPTLPWGRSWPAPWESSESGWRWKHLFKTSSNTIIHYQWKFGSSFRNIFVEISRLQSKKCWRTEKKIDRFFQVFPGVQDNTTRETPPHCRLEAVGRGLPWCYANIWEHSFKGKDQKKNWKYLNLVFSSPLTRTLSTWPTSWLSPRATLLSWGQCTVCEYGGSDGHVK